MVSSLRKFGPYPAIGDGIPTAEASYKDGYETGLTWQEDYTPGGPHAFMHNGSSVMDRDPDWAAYCEATRVNLREWKRGFTEGRDAAFSAP